MGEGGVIERASGLVSILFTDLVGSTELLSRAGDEEAQRIFRAHHDLLSEVATAHGGDEVKWLGDGLMVAFPSAAGAVRAALAMQAASRRPVHGERLSIRVGLNAGEALREAADYFGLPVVVARRLCDRAEAGQTLCADVVAGLLAGRPEFAFRDLGKLELKGVSHAVTAFEVYGDAAPFRSLPAHMPFVGREPERQWPRPAGCSPNRVPVRSWPSLITTKPSSRRGTATRPELGRCSRPLEGNSEPSG